MIKSNNLDLLVGLSTLASKDISVSIRDLYNDGSCKVIINSDKAGTTIETNGNLNDDSFIDRLRGTVILLSSDNTIWG